jgi:hypothetical protein
MPLSQINSASIENGSVTPTDLAQPLTSGAAQPTVAGTSVDFTGIPSWVKRITVIFSNVSLNSTAAIIVQIGSGSVTTTGYISGTNWLSGTTTLAGTTSTIGMVFSPAGGPANGHSGTMTLNLVGANTWVETTACVLNNVSTYTVWGAGVVTLGGVLDRVRITTSNGTDTFDLGSVNILYE